MVADAGSFNPYGQPPQGGFGGPPAGGPPPGGGYGGPPPGGGYGSPDPGPGGGYGGPPLGGGYGGPPPGGYGGAPQGGYGSPQAAPMAYGGMPGGGGPMVQAGGRGPIGQTRNPVMVLVIGYVTCGIYMLIQMWGMWNELKAFRGKDDFNPILLLLFPLFFIWSMPAKILEAKQMAGVPNAQVPNVILYLLLGPYFLANDLNEIWQAAGGGQPR